MRCTTYCTAAAYDLTRLFQSLQKFGSAQLFRDCIHLLLKEDRKPKGDIFYLSYGCVVLWGFTEEEELAIMIKAKRSVPGQRVPKFSVTPPFDLDKQREITVTFTQIQYSQTVLLNFAGLTWPHVSVNTLVPADDIIVPPSVWM